MLIKNVFKKYQKIAPANCTPIIQVTISLIYKFIQEFTNHKLFLGTAEYPESCASNDSQYNLHLEDDQDIIKERIIPENGDNKLIEVIPVHDDDNDLTPSK